jgi:hypothetical protein
MGRVYNVQRKKRNIYKILLGNVNVLTTIGDPRIERNNNSKKVIRETGWGGIHWINQARDSER